MHNRIEEAFNDCFERLAVGESLESCLASYPQYAAELDTMLRTAFDVRRRAYPVQPRPEFKYWSRVRLQGVQDYVLRHPVEQKAPTFNLRRNLAISLAALLVFILASTGTAAASSDALPDEPLYGVKLAVEQAQVSLAFSDVDKAEVYAHLAEKRAGEIVAMARQGKTDKTSSTMARMNYQLDQAENYINKYQQANPDIEGDASGASVDVNGFSAPPAITNTDPSKNTLPSGAPGLQQGKPSTPPRPLPPALRATANVNRAKAAVNVSTTKSLAVLQNELENAPESVKPILRDIIIRTKKANEWSQQQVQFNNNRIVPPNVIPPKPTPAVPPNRPKVIIPPNTIRPNMQVMPPTSSTPGEENPDDDAGLDEKDNGRANSSTLAPMPPVIPAVKPVLPGTINNKAIINGTVTNSTPQPTGGALIK